MKWLLNDPNEQNKKKSNLSGEDWNAGLIFDFTGGITM